MDQLDGRVHIWHVDLIRDRDSTKRYWAILAENERERTHRLRGERLQRRFVVCRGQLRLLLARYLSVSPAAVSFVLGDNGKPRLAGTEPNQGLVFNVSHSGDTALFTVSHDQALGVDMEIRREINNMEGLVQRYFGPREQTYWYSLEPYRRKQGFFRMWTCKESFVKAVGLGISMGLEQCEVEIGARARFSSLPSEYGVPDEWQLEEIQINSGISAALTVYDHDCQIVYHGLLD